MRRLVSKPLRSACSFFCASTLCYLIQSAGSIAGTPEYYRAIYRTLRGLWPAVQRKMLLAQPACKCSWAMETLSLSTRGIYREDMGLRLFFPFLRLDSDTECQCTIGASASRSNLFFARMYGASQKPCFGLKPRSSA